MSRLIAPTPRLNREESLRFLERVERGLARPTYLIPTPNIEKVIERIMADARKQGST